jgi:outer membrane protein OmpA-like peptidoglycan-associated protein
LWGDTITANKGKLMLNKSVLCVVLAMLAAPAHAFTLEFPGAAVNTVAPAPARASYALPTGPWVAGVLPSDTINGTVERAAWSLDAPGLATLDLMDALRAQLISAGFSVVLDCETEGCGGFDFRFAIDVLPEPAMHVDLGDFRFLSARRSTAEGPEAIGLMVSRSNARSFVQMTRAVADTGPALFAATNRAGDGLVLPLTPAPRTVLPVLGAMEGMTTDGSVVLDGLDFGTGAAELTEGRYPALAALAEWLAAHPEKSVALVGHTDASGGLDGNIVVSKRRAASVRTRLLETYGVPSAQVEAHGVGYLAPIASNATEAGRQKNRRVEAVITSTP